MAVAVFCQWGTPPPAKRTRVRSRGAADGQVVRGAEIDGGPHRLAVYFANEVSQAGRVLESGLGGILSDTATAETSVGVEIGDTGESEPGAYLFVVTFGVPAAEQADFDSWYEKEHVPILMEADGWLRCRRYAAAPSTPAAPTRLALHELSTLEALSSPERLASAATEWRGRLAARPWFSTARFVTYERLVEETQLRPTAPARGRTADGTR
jgi:hypothetical protein